MENIENVFKLLNKKCKYLVLRNFEGFFEDILIEGHNDIDVLCASKKDRKIMVNILQAVPRIGVDNGIHYKFLYNGSEIDLDIRTVGDGYYDEKWQKRMISKREFNEKGFYTMDPENYFYSLIYHSIYQKKVFTEEYKKRLQKMNPDFCNATKEDFEKALLKFMIKKNYFYTKTYDNYVVLYFNNSLVGDRIIYPFKVKTRHFIEAKLGYVFGKMNGAKLRILNFFHK